jgi:hypothetical protein
VSKQIESSFEIDFDHFQFLIGDKTNGPLIDTATLWDTSQLIGSVDHASEIVGISTVRYGGKLKVLVLVSETPEIDCDSWNRIGLFDIDLPSGKLIVWGPETDNLDQSPTVSVPPGRYAGAAYSRGTDDVTDEMENEGPDEYCVVISRIGSDPKRQT